MDCRGEWLFRKESLADAFRNRFLKRLRSLRRRGKLRYTDRIAHLADDTAWGTFLAALAQKTWVVFPKATPQDPEQALD